jgi:phosphatidylinositol alpha-1,6-mannosyltransferase
VLRKFPDVAYLIVGEGPQQQTLQQTAQGLGIADRVTFAGSIDHGRTADFYNAAEIVVLPNRAEGGEADGLPLVFLEANACAKPVIGGKAGGTAEIVRDGENGLLVDGGNVAEIEAAICALLGDETRASAMGQEGRRMAQGWGWQARTQSFLEACRK